MKRVELHWWIWRGWFRLPLPPPQPTNKFSNPWGFSEVSGKYHNGGEIFQLRENHRVKLSLIFYYIVWSFFCLRRFSCSEMRWQDSPRSVNSLNMTTFCRSWTFRLMRWTTCVPCASPAERRGCPRACRLVTAVSSETLLNPRKQKCSLRPACTHSLPLMTSLCPRVSKSLPKFWGKKPKVTTKVTLTSHQQERKEIGNNCHPKNSNFLN